MKKSLLTSTVSVFVLLIPTVLSATPYWYITLPSSTQGYADKFVGPSRVYVSASAGVTGTGGPPANAALQFGRYVGSSQIMENWRPIMVTAIPFPAPTTPGYFLTVGGLFAYLDPPRRSRPLLANW